MSFRSRDVIESSETTCYTRAHCVSLDILEFYTGNTVAARAEQKIGVSGKVMLPVSPRVMPLFFVKYLHLFISHHQSYQECGMSRREERGS